MPARKKKEPQVQTPVDPDDSLGLPQVEPSAPAVPVTPEAYAAARAALAAQMVGPLYGQLLDEPEPLVHVAEPAPIAPIVPIAPKAPILPPAPVAPIVPPVPTPAATPLVTASAAAPVAMAQVARSNVDSAPATTDKDQPKHRRKLVVAAALLLLGAVALSTELVPIVMKSAPTAPIAAVQPSPTDSPSAADPTTAAPTLAAQDPTVTAAPTPAPTKKPAPKPTRRPTPRPTAKPPTGPTPTPVMYVAWVSIAPGPPPTFTVKTRAGATCTITRTWADGTHARTANFPSPANASGVAAFKWTGPTWTSGTTYKVTAKCTLGTGSASVANQVTIP